MAEEMGQSRARVTADGLVGTEKSWARFLVVHDDWDGWLFALTVGATGDLISFEMYGDGPSAGREDVKVTRSTGGVFIPPEPIALTARLVRTVPFRELEAALRRRLSGADGVLRSAWLGHRLAQLDPAPQRRPRAKWTEHELAGLCADYVALVDAADPTPLATLATQRTLSPKYVRNLIAGVRGDLITHSRAGLAGGQLTDKAKELLRGDNQAT